MPSRKKGAQRPLKDEVKSALTSLERKSTKHDRENLARFGISASKAFGVSMANMRLLARRLGRNHELAAALWDTGWYEARMLASLVDEPTRVTPTQMDRWCRESFVQGLRFIERAADDERNFVKKAVNMALRAVGKRNPALNVAAVTLARRLANSPHAAARWVGKDALGELTSPAVIRRLATRRSHDAP